MTQNINQLLDRAKEYDVAGKAIPINADECSKMCLLIKELSAELEKLQSPVVGNDVQAALKSVDFLKCSEHLFKEARSQRDYHYDIIERVLAQQQPDDETYQKLVHTQSDLEHSRTFAKDLSRQLDELKRECAEAKIELVRIRKQQPDADLLEALKKLTKNVEDVARESFATGERHFKYDFAINDPDGFEAWDAACTAIANAEKKGGE